MALKYEGYNLSDWENWSSQDSKRYHPGECAKKWKTFDGSNSGKPITGATITSMAKEHGWKPSSSREQRALDWDDVITVESDRPAIDTDKVDGQEVKEPTEWNPVNDALRYLKTLFEPGDHVGYVVTARQQENGKWFPGDKGNYKMTAEKLEQELVKHPDDITYAIGDYEHQAGVWIHINPLDGEDVKDENVTAFRYALVESDTLPLDKQNAILRKLKLPIAALVCSGGKSLHAIVRVDAGNISEYRERVAFLYEFCKKNKLEIDEQNKNPARLSRLPGVERNGKKQFLVDTNIGKKDWKEWQEWAETFNDNLPPIENAADLLKNMPPLSPPLIDGVLRQGHKMLLAGPSKAGKSFALIELAAAIAEGKKWLERFQCAQGRVLYVNLELDRASCAHRFDDVYNGLGWEKRNINSINIWNLRGEAVPMDKLVPQLIARCKNDHYMAIIIDPIYKVLTGDENSASDMANFCNQFDKICKKLKCSTIYCHHHSKGLQGFKSAMDRASGSGVFARDPDAFLDMSPLDLPSAPQQELDFNSVVDCSDDRKAYRITSRLREFTEFRPVNVFFDWPVHHLDRAGVLETAEVTGSLNSVRNKGRKRGAQANKENANDRAQKMLVEYSKLVKDGPVRMAALQEVLKCSVTSIKRYAKNLNLDWTYKDGFIHQPGETPVETAPAKEQEKATNTSV
jgi:RecA-family ATPase